MQKILEIIIKQVISIYIGGSILYIYFKLIGKKVSYSDIINLNDESTGKKISIH